MTLRGTLSIAAATIVLATTAVSGPARAQSDPAALKAAQELVDLSLADGLREQLVTQSWPPLEGVIRKTAPKLDDSQVEALRVEFIALMEKEMTDAMADTPALYAKYFSSAELKDLLAFYRTETGKKTLSVMPSLMGEIMERTMTRMPDMMERIKTSFSRVLLQKGVKIPQ